MHANQLKQVPFVSAVPEKELEPWARAATPVEGIPRRGVWTIPDQQQHDLFLLAQGVAVATRATRDGLTRATQVVDPTGCLNVQCLFPRPLGAETVLALAETELIRIPGDLARKALDRGGPLARLLAAYAAARVVEVTDDMLAGDLDLTPRVAAWLLRLSERLGSVMVPVSQEQFAQMVGARREAVAGVLGILREDDVIDTRYRMIKIYQPATLRDLAGNLYPTAMDPSAPRPLTGAACL